MSFRRYVAAPITHPGEKVPLFNLELLGIKILSVAWFWCYKTFYDRILRIFIIRQRVCPWQAFQASITAIKSFTGLAPGLDIIKLFMAVILIFL
jgi:hypothetical protein